MRGLAITLTLTLAIVFALIVVSLATTPPRNYYNPTIYERWT